MENAGDFNMENVGCNVVVLQEIGDGGQWHWKF